MWGAIASIAGPVISGLLGSKSASSAEKAQAQANQSAIDEQQRQFNLNRADSEPWRTAGGQAINRLSDMLGTSTRTGAADYGALNKKFTLADFWDDPVTQASYSQGLELGQQAIDRMAGARGNRNSGATLKALSRFGTDYTGNQAAGSQARFVGDQTNTYNRLAGVAGSGQNAMQNTSALGQQSANNVSGLMSDMGNARGAAAIAQGNAWGGAANSIGNWWNQQQTLDKVLANKGGYNTGGYGGSQWSGG